VSPQTSLLRILAFVALSIGPAALFVYLFVVPTGPMRTAVTRYTESLDQKFRFLRSPVTGKQVLAYQCVAFIVVCLVAYLIAPVLTMLLAAVVVGPFVYIRKLREKRMIRLEQQLDGWLLILANALKAVPSIGDALASSQALVHVPMSQELDVVLKEYSLGTPLDVAMHNMGQRIKSRVISTALTMLQVARRTGGDLPSTLETAAASLRELARLEGVVRTKTADGRNQAMVVGSLPLVIIVLLYFVQPDLLMPMFETFKGNIMLGIAFMFWAGAIASALKILKVDI
jgi:tight adherence protein B